MFALLFDIIYSFLPLAHSPSNLPGVDEAWDALEQMHAEGKTTDKQPARISVLNLTAHLLRAGRGCHTIKSGHLCLPTMMSSVE